MVPKKEGTPLFFHVLFYMISRARAILFCPLPMATVPGHFARVFCNGGTPSLLPFPASIWSGQVYPLHLFDMDQIQHRGSKNF